MKLPVLFISHGGGPWPWIPEMNAQFKRTADWLKALPATLPEPPRAVLSISGHWEEEEFTVATAEHPPTIYDYSGFPEHTYHIKYEAQGSPAVASRVKALLEGRAIECRENPTHGFDHGTFVPLYLMYPKANIPVVSMSLKSSYDPEEHLRMGEALAPLRDEGVLIIGSGLSYHNMRGFRTEAAGNVSKVFGTWLSETVANPREVREKRLKDWEKAPAARLAHPYEDHLLPLMVVAGAAQDDQGKVVLNDHVMNVDMTSYQFG